MNRRDFLKFAGVLAFGVAAHQTVNIISQSRAKEEKKSTKTWAMAVSFSACARREGCKDCIDICHLIHNVPEFDNPKDGLRWIWQSPYEVVFSDQTNLFNKGMLKNLSVLCLCNHCDNPPCVKVCPTKATWKREDGIVMMDYHRCIGCRYCMAACPYGARSFNWRDPRPFLKKINTDYPNRIKGIVEKCSFCEERLSQGLIPACVDTCPEKALIFGDLNDPESDISRALRARFSIQRRPYLGTGPRVFYIF
ncbi:MAG: 4Fe-4S dicluster domain-containing protein [Syntrophorhabdaceae bacterium]|nr:4Fe-4S dicluster domain-containing protein [Syntrophorhabdaceae bacterium]